MNILISAYIRTTEKYLEKVSVDNKVLVCISKKSKEQVPKGVNTIRVKYYLEAFLPFLRIMKVDRVVPHIISKLEKEIKGIPIDIFIVIDFYNPTFYQFLKIKKKKTHSKLYIWSETRKWPSFWLSRWIAYFFWWYFKKNIKYIEKVFVFTKQGKLFFNTYAPEVVVEILPAPVDIEQFYPKENKEWLPQGKLRVLMNARFVALKDHRTLFKALKILKEKGVNFELSLIGRGGHLKDELLQYASDLDIRKYIKVLETVSLEELRDIYIQHDILVLPSNKEAIGMVVPEAMACGLPTITSSVVGANTYVKEGETGFIFEVGKARDLSDKISQLNDEKILKQFSQNAYNLIQKEYSKEVLGRRMSEEFNN